MLPTGIAGAAIVEKPTALAIKANAKTCFIRVSLNGRLPRPEPILSAPIYTLHRLVAVHTRSPHLKSVATEFFIFSSGFHCQVPKNNCKKISQNEKIQTSLLE
jgi:hypothetical protein